MTVAASRCVALPDLGGGGGGKADGLAALHRLGLAVPPAFVVLGATPDALPPDLAEAYSRLGGGRVAVRSSGFDEDGADASFAGQHATLLDVEGIDALRSALVECLASVRSEHASAYRRARGLAGAAMSVVVQRMVDARAAGVLFTVDPVSGRRDRLVIDAVPGLGEALVSGRVTPDHYLLDRSGVVVRRDLVGDAAVLDDATLRALIGDALDAERARGVPLDMEWAVDRSGRVHWLQARPITRLPPDVTDLDSPARADHVYTRCNIGEMMPGAITPLTWSVSGRGIDVGIRRVSERLGAYETIEEQPPLVHRFYGHLFFDLTAMADIARHVAGSDPQDTCVAVCGRAVPEVRVGPPAPLLRRLRNATRYARVVFSTDAHAEAIERSIASVAIPESGSAETLYDAIDAHVDHVADAYGHHLLSSTRAGAAVPALLAAVSADRAPTDSDHAEVAALLASAEGVESYDVAAGIDRIVAIAAGEPGAPVAFSELDAVELVARARGDALGETGRALVRYLERHGHRAIREAELRQREWAVDPAPVIDAVRRGLATGQRRKARPAVVRRVPWRLRPLVAFAHGGVRARERTKSLLIRLTVRLKVAYRRLASVLVARGSLPDDDAIYFLTHEELGALVHSPDPRWATLALARREAHAAQSALVFDDVVVGAPEPIEPAVPAGERVLRGTPVSRGVARGRARVARTIEEAGMVQAGEILIAPVTDVGWTPCFGVIAGLATDVGSAVSHGAVVAREYGLPAIVSLRTATTTFRTGDLVVLDADAGILRIDDD